MKNSRIAAFGVLIPITLMQTQAQPTLTGVGEAMQGMIDAREIAGAVTVVAARDGIVHLECTGNASAEEARAMRPDTLFFIASMTKPITAVAVLMLQEEGRLDVNDLVEKHLPEFADLRTPSGKPARLTITQILSHTSGMADISKNEAATTRTLADLIPLYLAEPMLFEPGTRWKYCQSGINTAARIVEVASGQPFEVFLEKRIFRPLGMRETTHYPRAEQRPRLVQTYEKDPATGRLVPVEGSSRSPERDRPPYGNSGLFSTGPDYARFCRMLLNGGTLDGHRIISPNSIRILTTNLTGDHEAGFVPGSAWGLGVGLVVEPRGMTAMLSTGTFGHGGAHGTQAWIDPVRDVAYILMIQRSNFPNSDGSPVRRAFQEAASEALAANGR